MTRNWLNFTPEDREKIREAYKPIMDDLKAGVRRDVYAIWPHEWYAYMSPIEYNVWQDIRSHGLPLYSQVPCGKFFIDFADPYMGIAIEVDGKEWHKDFKKDAEREDYIRAHGYPTVIRFTGKTTFTAIDYDAFEDEDYIPNIDSSEYQILQLRKMYLN